MMQLTDIERHKLIRLYRRLRQSAWDSVSYTQAKRLKEILIEAARLGRSKRNLFGMHPVVRDLQTALIIVEELNMRGAPLLGVMLHEAVKSGYLSKEEISEAFGSDVATIIGGLQKTDELYRKAPTIESENFRDLLLSFAEDMRVILIMIASRVNLMRQIGHAEDDNARRQIAGEASYLYAPLSHKLGLYKIKSELEDLSLKYTEPKVYQDIKEKLNESKTSRERYITSFIDPIKNKIEAAGLTFSIKGRTKSIHSIWNKMKKQHCEFEHIYDLFAIRIILDSPVDREKLDCWQAYSIVADMYQPNPKRLRDWLSIPKSNGYESLHITVMGPEAKWVEVQIRTQRMDEIAERGLAAHWRYKGVKASGENGMEQILASVRSALESHDEDNMRVMDQFKMDLYADDVFIFTPKGDLFKLPKGATVLDLAFHIHSKLGCRCIGARVNGRNAPIRQELSSGDQVEILTSNSQSPKSGWLNIVTTGRARTKIRQELKEMASKQSDFVKEDIQRKFKNRKIEYDEGVMMRLIKKLGYKTVTDFYQSIAEGTIDVNDVVDKYLESAHREKEPEEIIPHRSAENYSLSTVETEQTKKDDVLVIDKNLRDIDFTLSKCCNPIYGDEVFGFVTVSGGIKVHRCDCPNAPQMRERFGYRIVKARWAGKATGKQYPITLRVVGIDDIGIVTNISSVISKEPDTSLRSFSIESHDGLFTGQLTVNISDVSKLDSLIKKLRAIRGVKQVIR
ncbi:MAG: bifunctional (p)ppGpp synthetase/guanosine-3',5'-bis(diphosphate) 3'-pyrophosphohydrolase [Bacteroidaceae bacterium]|nr:bifunctional (p)ppGpp synthetase/guanosine-3',5'-bis(diphosphate) 3'-pyrophosphohydrolase [Bacteroidaceae bacterium]